MKFIIISFYLLNISAFAGLIPIDTQPDVVYGQDDRLDIYESSDDLMKDISRSTAALIRNYRLNETNGGFEINAPTLEQNGMCSNERFANQVTAAGCSGFLVAPDKLVTAGHCVSSEKECQGHFWVFDYANRESVQTSFTFSKDQIYRCTKIIERKKDETTLADYAVLKLDRPVKGRKPLKIRQNGKPLDDAVFTVIGHPSGLPTKIASAADMRDNTNPIYFTTNSDTFSINSGSVVVDSRTGVVEGLLVRGDTDYALTPEGCMASIRHPQTGGAGEGVTRITIIESLKTKRTNPTLK